MRLFPARSRVASVFTVLITFLLSAVAAFASGHPADPSVSLNGTTVSYGAPGNTSGYTSIGVSLSFLSGFAIDKSGNYYFADTTGKQIVRYTPGDTSTVLLNASTTITNSSTAFSTPTRIAVDQNKNVYVLDNANKRILMISGTSPNPVSVVVSTNPSGGALVFPNNVAVDDAGDLYISDAGQSVVANRLMKIAYNTANGSVAGSTPTTITTTGVTINGPTAVGVDHLGDIYAYDNSSQATDKIDTNGVVTAFTGATGAIYGYAFDSANNVYFADYGDREFLKFPAGGTYTAIVGDTNDGAYIVQPNTTIIGNGSPAGIAIDPQGNVVTAPDFLSSTTTYATASTPYPNSAFSFPSTPVNTSAASTTLTFTLGSGTTIGSITYWADGAQNGDFTALANDTSSTLCKAQAYGSTSAYYTCTLDVVFTPKYPSQRRGAIVFRDGSNNVLLTVPVYGIGQGALGQFDPGTISTLAGINPGTGQAATAGYGGTTAATAVFHSPAAIAINASGTYYVADSQNAIVRMIAPGGTMTTVAGMAQSTSTTPTASGTATAIKLDVPYGLALAPNGDLYISDESQNVIYKLDQVTGTLTLVAGGGSSLGSGIAGTAAILGSPGTMFLDAYGDLYFSESAHGLIRMFNTQTGIVTNIAGGGSAALPSPYGDGGPATSAYLSQPIGVAVDVSGNVYISDSSHHVIRKVDTSGNISKYAGTYTTMSTSSGDGLQASAAYFSGLGTLAFDAAGQLIIADYKAGLIRRINTSGVINTIAGTLTPPTVSGSTATYYGDGGLATSAVLNYPHNFALSPAGDLVISESLNNVIRGVLRSYPTLSFADTAVGSTSTDSPQTLTFTNTGNSTLTLTPPTTGTNPSMPASFGLANLSSSGSCPQLGTNSSAYSLTTGQSCTMAVTFTPVAPDTNTGLVAILDNSYQANGSPAAQHFAVTGNATAPPITGFTISSLSSGTAGTAQGITITALNNGSTATNFTGSVTITSTDPNATINGQTIGTGITLIFTSGMNGVMTLSGASGVVFETAGSQTITVSVGNVSQTTTGVTVNAATASRISVVSGTPQSATIGTAFATPLKVKITDAYSNTVSGSTVSFTAPSTGASATFSTTSPTAADGTTSVTATANGTASTTAYTVTATAQAFSTSNAVTFSLTNTTTTPTLTLTTSPTITAVYGQPIILTATSSPATISGSSPAGNVTFKDSTNTLTSSATPTAGVSTYTVTGASVGGHSYTASAAADTNFAAAATASPAAVTVNKATATATLPATTTTVTIGSATTTVALTISGQYSGSGITSPTGTISYYFTASGSQTQIGASTLTAVNGTSSYSIPVPSSIANSSGSYTLSVTYGGDGNYNAISTAVTAAVMVGTPTFTVTANPTQLTINRGSSGMATLTFTPTGGYQGTATMTCTGLPAYATCQFTPSSLTFSGDNTVQMVSLTVSTVAPKVEPGSGAAGLPWITAIAFGLLLFVSRKRLSKPLYSLLMLLVFAIASMGLSGCAKHSSPGTPTGTTSLQVNVSATATAGTNSTNLNQTATISIIVQ